MVAPRKSVRASLLAMLALALRAGLSDACSCLARDYCAITEGTDIIVSGPITGRCGANGSYVWDEIDLLGPLDPSLSMKHFLSWLHVLKGGP